MNTIQITHYSDVLCVWAYAGQVRVTELQDNFPDEVAFDFRYFNVFGDVVTKMRTQWAEKGGLSGYAGHVHEVAGGFEHVRLSADTWHKTAPASSFPAHLFIAAARLLDEAQGTRCAQPLDAAIRRAFFADAVDVSHMDELRAIGSGEGLDVDALQQQIDAGLAHARLARDLKQAADAGIRSSPTMTFNEGRQTLTGNVGYRVLEANIRELLRHPSAQQSWC